MPAFPFALPPKQSNGLIYTGYGLNLMPAVEFPRAPRVSDVNYPLFTIWRNSNPNAVLPDAIGDMWYLAYAFFSGGTQEAKWLKLASANSGPLFQFDIPLPTSPVFPTASGVITFTSSGGTIAISGPSLNTINFDVVGGQAIDNIVTDTGGAGLHGATINLNSAVPYATATGPNSLTITNSSATQGNIALQLAGSSATVTPNDFGISQYNSAQFNVASGFVSLIGGSTPAIQGIIPNAHTAPGTSPVVANASGNITIEGGSTFTTGTQADPIRTNSLAANTIDLQIQLAGSNAATSTPNNFGVSQFDSNQFNVVGGFVQLAGGTTGAFERVVRQVFTTSGTYTPTTGMLYADVETLAGGGAGGASAATTAPTVSIGGGGGAGEYARGIFSASTIGASQVVTIGAGGVGNNAGIGGSGGTTSLGSLITSLGGGGGNLTGAAGVGQTNGGNGGIGGTGGNLRAAGGHGFAGFGTAVSGPILSGAGSPSQYGGGGGSVFAAGPGMPGASFGSGGSGAASFGAIAAQTGGNGIAGIVIITEYCT